MKSTRQNLMLKNILAAAVLGVTAVVANAAPSIFNSSGSYTVPAGVFSIDYLVVGGGGGGGGTNGGGGGGGQFIEAFGLAVTPGDEFTITIGAGGLVDLSEPYQRGFTGGTSILNRTSGPVFSISAFGGGGGGAVDNNGAGLGGAGTGSAGGNGFDNPFDDIAGVLGGNGFSGGKNGGEDTNGGGGGGAGGNGGNGGASNNQGGNGGIGAQSVITGLYYAGGGGGATGTNLLTGVGGLGGGGKGGFGWGSPTFFPTAGTPNTGGGGGGGDEAPGTGGSGVVVILETVPEPGTMGLLGLASGALLLRRRRKN